jgi:Glycosyl transferase family 2
MDQTWTESAKDRQMPTASVIICAHTEERWAVMAEAVEAVTVRSAAPLEVLLVVDHNDALLDRAAMRWGPPVRVMPNEEGRGLSGARNTGVGHAEGDVAVFLDDDAVRRLRAWSSCCGRRSPRWGTDRAPTARPRSATTAPWRATSWPARHSRATPSSRWTSSRSSAPTRRCPPGAPSSWASLRGHLHERAGDVVDERRRAPPLRAGDPLHQGASGRLPDRDAEQPEGLYRPTTARRSRCWTGSPSSPRSTRT